MKTVLDVGAYDGGASREFVEKGDRWILVDNCQYERYDGWKRPAMADEELDYQEYYNMDIFDYHDPADIVVCANVIYHVEDPWALIKHLRKLTLNTMILKTQTDPVGSGDWCWHNVENPLSGHASTNETIFYRPTEQALLNELRAVGFTCGEVQHVDGIFSVFICGVGRKRLNLDVPEEKGVQCKVWE